MTTQAVPTAAVPTAAVELAERGHWSTAWPHVAPLAAALVRDGSCEDLLWLHELCRHTSLDVRRRWIGRALRRRFPGDLRVRALIAADHLRRGRLVDAWYDVREPAAEGAPAADRAGWLLVQARVHSQLRDHGSAMELLDAAEVLVPGDPRIVVERIWALQAADRVGEALAACAVARQRHPGNANLAAAECWIRHDANVPDVLEHIAAARRELRSPYLDALYANLCYENGDFAAASALWEQLLAEPWHERRARVGWHFALVHLYRSLGDDERALQHAIATGHPGRSYVQRLREHVATPAPRPRVLHHVPFVRQDASTCAPATIASLLGWFGELVDQRAIAAQITWDGTTSQDELRWARAHGLVIRFFQFDAAVARSLLDLGLPFSLSTRFETHGHRQAVVGYDPVLQTFVLRDPGVHWLREVDADWLIDITARGGDCALLLPRAVAERIHVPPLPAEAELAEWLQLRLDLDARRIANIDARIDELLARATGPLRFDVEVRTLAERGERVRRLAAYREAHERAPADPYWQFRWIAELLDQHRWHEARAALEQFAPASRSPFLQRLLADQWRHDARLRPAAEAMMRRALRILGRDARTWERHAALVHDAGRRDESAALYRTAAMLEPTDEWLAEAYFRALQNRGQAERGLDWLRTRVTTAAARSSAPAGTLADALEGMHRPAEAIEVMRGALAVDDTPEQRNRLCQLLLRHRHLEEAQQLLAATDRFRAIDHALRRCDLARARGDRMEVIAALRDGVAAMPTHVTAQVALLEETFAEHGLEQALARADALVEQHHEHTALVVDVLEFLKRVEDHARVERVLRRLVAEQPHQHWLAGRLARHLLARGRIDEAAPILEELKIATPGSAAVWIDVAELARASGDAEGTKVAARRALELDPGNQWPLRLLLNVAGSRDEAIATLRMHLRLLAERPHAPVAGEVEQLLDLVPLLPDGEFDAWLTSLAESFPGRTAVRVARCEFVLRADPGKALPLAEALVAAEPWNTDHHLRLARCLRACNRRADERKALEALLVVDAACAQAFVELGESFDQEGRLPQAVATFERGLERAPGYAVLRGMLAEALWRLGKPERALASAERACELDPSYTWAFEARIRWLGALGRAAEALPIAEEQVREHPHWPPAHELLARALAALGRQDERVDSLQRALALAPRASRVRGLLVDTLVELGRHDEARAIVRAAVEQLGDDPALELRGIRIDRAQRHTDQARARLTALLASHPTFVAGWHTQLEWYDEDGDLDAILRLHRDPPPVLRDDATLYTYAATAFRRQDRTAEAEAALERALQLDPGYAWVRDTLCEIMLERGRPLRVLELLPDHARPEALPYHHAVLVAKAAARARRFDVARRSFERLLQDGSGEGLAIAEVDFELRRRRAPDHEQWLAAAVARPDAPPAVLQNQLRVLAGRGDLRAFWRAVARAHASITPTAGFAGIAKVLAEVRANRPLRRLVPWVRANLRAPFREAVAAGPLIGALSYDPQGAREIVRLFAAHWRELDLDGPALANLGSALLVTGRLHDAQQVAHRGLDRTPADHSQWWHRRNLADAALRLGDFAAARQWCAVASDEHPGVRLAVHQIDLLAELHMTPRGHRGRVLRARLPEMFRRLAAAMAKNDPPLGGLRARQLFAVAPGWMTFLLLCGTPTTRLLRALLRV